MFSLGASHLTLSTTQFSKFTGAVNRFTSFVCLQAIEVTPASILYKSTAGRYRPVRVADWRITARYRFIKSAYWNVYYDTSSLILRGEGG